MEIDFDKSGGLVPAIIQDATTKNVLMLGFINKEALDKTLATGKVTFWSRSRNCLWTKGETSGNYLNLVSVKSDCDNDTLLVRATPDGPTCHMARTPAGARRMPTTPSCFSASCRISSTADARRCPKAATPPRSSTRDSTV